MKSKALVIYEKNGPFVLDEIELEAPRAGEVLVRIAAAGLCHTDLLAREKGEETAFNDIPLPMVLGHEGSGVVAEVGPDVDYCSVGDHVVLSYNHCEVCAGCHSGVTSTCEEFVPLNFCGAQRGGGTRLYKDGQPVSTFFGQSSFAHYAITNSSNTIVIPKDVPVELFGPFGCGIQTGAGAVFYKLHPIPGDSIAVFGCGSVGLSALLAAKACGCTTIIAVDVFDSKLELARTLGATHTVNVRGCDADREIHKIIKGGVNYAAETTGNGKVLSQSLNCLAPGGTTCVIGTGSREVTFDIDLLRSERHVVGVIEGSLDPHIQIPRLIELYKHGFFPIEKFTAFYDMKDMDKALEATKNGTVIKAVIRMN
jgi:aryl-alcohol dehydrogenase